MYATRRYCSVVDFVALVFGCKKAETKRASPRSGQIRVGFAAVATGFRAYYSDRESHASRFKKLCPEKLTIPTAILKKISIIILCLYLLHPLLFICS